MFFPLNMSPVLTDFSYATKVNRIPLRKEQYLMSHEAVHESTTQHLEFKNKYKPEESRGSGT